MSGNNMESLNRSHAQQQQLWSLRRQKKKNCMLIRVLIKYLEKRDPRLHHNAKFIIKDCVLRNKRQEKGYECVSAALKERLKKLVGEQHWKRAKAYLKHFLEQKQAAAALRRAVAGHDPAPKSF